MRHAPRDESESFNLESEIRGKSAARAGHNRLRDIKTL